MLSELLVQFAQVALGECEHLSHGFGDRLVQGPEEDGHGKQSNCHLPEGGPHRLQQHEHCQAWGRGEQERQVFGTILPKPAEL